MKKIFLMMLLVSSVSYGFLDIQEIRYYFEADRKFADGTQMESWSPYIINFNKNGIPVKGVFTYERTDSQFTGIFHRELTAIDTTGLSILTEMKWQIAFMVHEPVIVNSFFRNENYPDWIKVSTPFLINNSIPKFYDFTANPGLLYYLYHEGSSILDGNHTYADLMITMTSIPEPCTLLLLGVGGVMIRKR